jgi:hypothetical protein
MGEEGGEVVGGSEDKGGRWVGLIGHIIGTWRIQKVCTATGRGRNIHYRTKPTSKLLFGRVRDGPRAAGVSEVEGDSTLYMA